MTDLIIGAIQLCTTWNCTIKILLCY